MGKRMAEQLEDDIFFAEPNYDLMSDEELDELYNFGKLRSVPKRRAAVAHKKMKKARPEFYDDEENWLETDFADDDDLFDD